MSLARRGREPRLAGQIPAAVVAGGKGKPVREDQGVSVGLAGGDVMVGVNRRGKNGDDPKWRRWSSSMAAVFRRGGSPVVVQRLGKNSRGTRRFDSSPWRGLR
jgi:hypothetical protein